MSNYGKQHLVWDLDQKKITHPSSTVQNVSHEGRFKAFRDFFGTFKRYFILEKMNRLVFCMRLDFTVTNANEDALSMMTCLT